MPPPSSIGPLVAAAGGMRLDFVGRAEGDVDAAAVGLPAGNARGEALVGVGDAAVVLFLELVLGGVRRGVAAQPELLDELLALFVRLQALEGVPLLVGDDVGDVLVQPLAVGRLELLAELVLPPAPLLLGHRLGDGFPLGGSGGLFLVGREAEVHGPDEQDRVNQ